MASTFIGNTTAIRDLFKRVGDQFSKMYSRRAFIQWYVREGIECVEFDEARSNMSDLVQEYEMYEMAGIESSSEGEEEESEGT
jgi:tubulin beta